METVQKIEDKMADAFKDLPHLPETTRKSLVSAWPWIALLAGILQLVTAWGLWNLTRVANHLTDLANSLSVYYSGYKIGPSASEKTIIYVGLVMLGVDAVILLMAYPHLVKRARRGWDLLFLGALINLVYSFVQIFTYERGVGSFIMSLLGSAIGFYLLFEVRGKYGAKKSEAPTPVTKK